MQKLLKLDPIALVTLLALLVGMKFGVVPAMDPETMLMVAIGAAGARTYFEHAKARDLNALKADLDALKAEAAAMAKELEAPAEASPPQE